MAGSYPVYGIVYDTDGTTPLASVTVTARNESTNYTITEITNASGEYILDLGNLTGGWNDGDNITVYITYTSKEKVVTFEIDTATYPGGYEQNLTLVSVSISIAQLRYYTIQDFLDFFNLKSYETDAENGIKVQRIIKVGKMVEKGIDEDTGSVFDDNEGSYYSKTEHIDTDEYQQFYHVSKLPVISVTTCATTDSDQETVPDYTNNSSSWTSLTEGTDFVIDLDTGRIQIVNSTYYPITRRWGLYLVYTYGRSTVPEDIKQLSIIETGLKLLGANVVKSKVTGHDKETGDLDWFTRYRNTVVSRYSSDAPLNT